MTVCAHLRGTSHEENSSAVEFKSKLEHLVAKQDSCKECRSVNRLSEPSQFYFRELQAITSWHILGRGKTSETLVIGKGSPSRPTETFSIQGSESSRLSQPGQAIARLQIASEALFTLVLLTE